MNTIVRLLLVVLMLAGSFVGYVPLNAQGQPAACATIIEGQIASDNELQEFMVDLHQGQRLIVYSEVPDTYSDLEVELGLIAPSGFVINETHTGGWAEKMQVIATAPLSETGQYRLQVYGETRSGGTYVLNIACVEIDGTVLSTTPYVQQAQCGDIITGDFSREMMYRYFLLLQSGDRLQVTAENPSTYSDLELEIGLTAPSDFVIDELHTGGWADPFQTLETEPLAESGVYRLGLLGETDNGGPFILSIGCTRRDGTQINPGSISSSGSSSAQNEAQVPVPLSGTGFPGLGPVDFGNAAHLPLISGLPMSGAISPGKSEVLVFALDNPSTSALDLSVTRVSGNLSLGVILLSSDNDVLFVGGLTQASGLSASVPSIASGEFLVGIFELMLGTPTNPEPTAFTVSVELVSGCC